MSWSTVSKAADRSRRTRAAKSPRSTAMRMWDKTRKTAVSVEWPGRKPDCSGSQTWNWVTFCDPVPCLVAATDQRLSGISTSADAPRCVQAVSTIPIDWKWVGTMQRQWGRDPTSSWLSRAGYGRLGCLHVGFILSCCTFVPCHYVVLVHGFRYLLLLIISRDTRWRQLWCKSACCCYTKADVMSPYHNSHGASRPTCTMCNVCMFLNIVTHWI